MERARDRKCNLVGKDNVPLQELSSSETCLAEYISQKTAEIAAAKGDPKRLFGRHTTSPSPNADAVDLCVAQIHSANACGDFLRVSRVFQMDTEVAEREALVTAEVEMVVLSPFSACSPVASSCTGTCWDTKTGKAKSGAGQPGEFPGVAPIEGREVVRVSENRRWQLALQYVGPSTNQRRNCGQRRTLRGI